MPNTDIRSLVDAFVADLEVLIRAEALDAVQGALGGVAAPTRRGPGRPRKKATRRPGRPRKAKASKASKAPRRAKAGKRVRRSPEELEAMQGDVLAWVRSNPGEGMEAISQGLGLPSKELKRPIQMLIAGGKMRTEGQKRGTTYFAGSGGGRRKAGGSRKTATKRSSKKASSRKAGKKRTAKKATRKRKTVSKAA